VRGVGVGDPDAMRVATEVGEDVLGSAEGLLGVDDPPLLRELGHQAVEGLWVARVVEAGKDTARVEPLGALFRGKFLSQRTR